jgi:S-formylglutathione hydrolase FrmB
VQMVTLLPAGAHPAGLTVVLALHGSDSDATAMARLMAPAMTAAQVTNLAVVCADGGDTYWHAHTDGDDPVGMIVHEVLPRARADGLRGGPLGVIGASMGGYGALLLAERFGAVLIGRTGAGNGSAKALPVSSLPPVITAVAALSPAIFGSFAAARAANHAAFDSPAEFARNDVLAGAHALARVPAWIACGVDDPFGPQTAALRARLTTLTGHQVPGGMLPGCHDDAFWARNMPAALRFLAARYP